MLIGVDFDNTIVCFDGLFHRLALDRRLIPATVPSTKTAVRDYLRRQGQEDAWTELQGEAYGAQLQKAPCFPGVLEFFKRCAERQVPVRIISHKTRHPFLGPRYDLHQAALNWLGSQGFFDPAAGGLQRSQVHFVLTKSEKLQQIERSGCTHFIDDLPEFLLEPEFPGGVERILFAPQESPEPSRGLRCMDSWSQIEASLLVS